MKKFLSLFHYKKEISKMKLKKIISLGVVAALLMSTMSVKSSQATDNGTNKPATVENLTTAVVNNKSEVVYGKLSADGTINAVYVVNHFEVEKAGSIADYGNYTSVQNLTESKQIVSDGDLVSLQAEAGDFYYQGNMEANDLPWTIEITYDMNGESISPQDIAGKSGKLGIHIITKQNANVNTTFFENYMLQISLTLKSDKCSNISAPEATVAEAGNNTILAFTVMPSKNADCQVTADVNDFTMSGIELTAMPFSMSIDLPNTDGMLKDFEKLPEAISDLNDGVGKLADGTSELKKGANQFMNGSGDFKNGLSELKKNSYQITGASTRINDALSTISSSLTSGSSKADLSNLMQLPTVLNELSKGLKGISGGLTELKSGYSSSYTALDSSIMGIPDTAITKEQINEQFPNADDKQSQLLNQLYEAYVAGQTVKGTYGQVKQAFASVAPTIENMTVNIDTISGALDKISSEIEGSLTGLDITAQLGQLSKGLTELANNYSNFDKGLKEYMNGVGTLSNGYNQFDAGITEFANGVSNLNNGVSELYDGTNTLNDEVSKMPDKMQEEIDNLTNEYVGKEFEKISFVSLKNANTGLVQFVLKCDEIKLPEETKATTESSGGTDQNETILDRFLSLFKKD